MFSWTLVPLQYLFLRWKAEKLHKKAADAKDARSHARALNAAMAATATVEILQARFQHVTDRIDAITNRDVCRDGFSA